MLIAKPKHVDISREVFEYHLGYNPSKYKQFGVCYVGEDEKVILKRNIFNYEFFAELVVNDLKGQSALISINKDFDINPEQLSTQKLECQPMKINSNLFFGLEGDFEYKIDQVNSKAFKAIFENPNLVKSNQIQWMLKEMLNDHKNTLAFMDKKGKFTFINQHSRFESDGLMIMDYGVAYRAPFKAWGIKPSFNNVNSNLQVAVKGH